MRRIHRLAAWFTVVCVLLLATERPARANSLPTGTQVVLIFVAVGVVGAGIGVGVYYAVRKSGSITGCTVAGGAGLSLRGEADGRSLALTGDTADLRAGERVRLKGRKKKDAGGGGRFVVEKVAKDLGTCGAGVATP